MARKNRIKVQSEQAIYHCTTRTVRKTFFFESAAMREWIYKRICFLSSVYFVELHALAVLSNHYHIVFSLKKPKIDALELQKRFNRLQSLNRMPRQWCGEENRWYEKLTDLSEFMKEINQAIAVETNRRQGCTGHVWEGRFKSQVVEPGTGLLACISYVELNPVRAGLCQKPSQYRWCSAGRFHLGGAKAAGISVPKLASFDNFPKQHHQRALVRLVDSIAMSEAGIDFTQDDTWQAWVEAMDLDAIFDLKTWCLKKRNWLRNSLIIGSAGFCEKMAVQLKLHGKTRNGARAFRLFGGVCNTKLRNGPFLL